VNGDTAAVVCCIKSTKAETFCIRAPISARRLAGIYARQQSQKFSEAVIYHTVASDLSDLSDVKYDCIAFQSVGHQLSLHQFS
jgi:uroporphyrinogen-III synthase